MQYDLSHIKSVESLRREKIAVRQRLDQTQRDLSRKMYEIPAELAAAGANSFIPSFLRGKVTNAALSGGKKLINKFFVPEDDGPKLLPQAQKTVGLLSGLKKAISLFRKR